jgi:hypothetical protein
MATVLQGGRLFGCFYSNRFSWKSRINSKLVIQCDSQSMRNFSLKLLSNLSKGFKKQLDDVKILTSLRVSNM